MKIAYVSYQKPLDIHACSGTVYHIHKAFVESGCEVFSINSLFEENHFVNRLKETYYTTFLKKKYRKNRSPRVLNSFAMQIENVLHYLDVDVLFSTSSILIAKLKTDIPVVFWTDSTFAGMLDFYPSFSNLCDESIRYGNQQEQSALDLCSRAFYASQWAADTAVDNYSVDPAKIQIAPRGANINSNLSEEEMSSLIKNKSFEPLNLLFVGVSWKRKGGDKAVKIAEILNSRGVNTILHIVGCKPPVKMPPFVKDHGFISKKTKLGLKKIKQLFLTSNLFILPSLQECFGIVFAEASAFGLPSLATNVGGIPSAIRNGINGKTFSVEAHPEEYCDYIIELISDQNKYRELALSSFNEYRIRLNWPSSIKSILQELNYLI